MINDYACTDCTNTQLRTKYQGDDLILNIKLKTPKGTYVDLTTYENVYIYAYTDYDDLVVKGSLIPQTGYVTLNVIDNYTYEFVIDSLYTTQMTPGILKLEINFVKSSANDDILDGMHNSIAVNYAALYIAESNIKAESNPGIS